MGMDDFEQFKQRVKRHTGIDLNQYKQPQMKRRLTSLRQKRGFASFAAYYDALIKDPELLNEFMDRMTINVSEFFRNPERWQVLERKILPRLLQHRSPLKIWSAACSTGEEPYSLVMLLSRLMPLEQIHVQATDIDQAAIDKAKQGIYVQRAVQHVPAHLLRTYFEHETGSYVLSEKIKSRVTFDRHNLLADPFPKGLDLILCRNVLIYFTEEAKRRLFQHFSQSLRNGGVLFVGSTEQIFYPETFGLEPEAPFFYRKL